MNSWRLELLLATLLLSAMAVGLLTRTARPQTVKFSHTLASFTTTLEGRTAAQKRNIALACSLIDNVTIAPGATFSFVDAVGPTTAERGFVKSNAYIDGETRPAYGGGCCQLASTVYNAALLANLEIGARSRHIWPVRSVPEGLDAAVNEETLDLRFTNRHVFPIRLHARVSGERVVVSFGAPQPMTERVKVVRRVLETVDAPRIVRADSTMPLLRIRRTGAVRRVRRGRAGCRVVVERLVAAADGASRRETVSDDFYGPRHGIVVTGSR